jgi:hypothetical protein
MAQTLGRFGIDVQCAHAWEDAHHAKRMHANSEKTRLARVPHTQISDEKVLHRLFLLD